MCDPLTIVAVGAAVGGSAVSAGAAASKGAAAANVAQRNSTMANQAAADAVQRAGVTELREQAKGAATIAAQRTGLASTGSDVDAGSAAAIQDDTKLFTQMDEEIVRNNAAREAYGYRVKGQEFQQEATYAKQEASQSELGSFIGGVGKIAGIAGPAIADMPSADPGGLSADGSSWSMGNQRGIFSGSS